jgi:hypothetical protein
MCDASSFKKKKEKGFMGGPGIYSGSGADGDAWHTHCQSASEPEPPQ